MVRQICTTMVYGGDYYWNNLPTPMKISPHSVLPLMSRIVQVITTYNNYIIKIVLKISNVNIIVNNTSSVKISNL